MPPMLRFDPSLAFLPQTGLEPSDVASLGAQLERLRDEVCDIDVKMLDGQIATPVSKLPLDAGFYLLPEKLLSEYEAHRGASLLGCILAATKQLMSEVDRVVVFGAGGSQLGPQAILDACCQPYFNELSRGERGSRPRMYFAGNCRGNDATQGLLHLLGAHRGTIANGASDNWGLVILQPPDAPLEFSSDLSHFLSALKTSCRTDQATVQQRMIAITDNSEQLQRSTGELLRPTIFAWPQQVNARYSPLSVAGLVPAALMGVNVMRLLDGARRMNEHFRTSKAVDNVVLQYAAVNHLMETRRGVHVRMLCAGSPALESTGRWLDHLFATSLARNPEGSTSLTTVSPRHFPTPKQPNALRGRDTMINHVTVESDRFDPLTTDLGTSSIEDATSATDNNELETQATAVASRPSTNISMPLVDEFYLGQFFQMMMLATVIEGRLMGVNPYGQSSVESTRKPKHI